MTGLYERDARTLSSMSFLRFFPQAVTGGEGSYLFDEGGRRLLDLSASWGAASLGHSHPAVRLAVDRALSNQAGASHLSGANLPAVELAERLLSIVPERAAGRVWLGHSGSDANETVARAVIAATGRPRIIAFKGAYHGGTVGSMAISGHPAQEGVPKAGGLTLVPYPNAYRDGGPEQASARALAHLDELFAGPVPPEEVAAFFLEPIQSDGGMIVPPLDFFRSVETLCHRYGILVVSDEVKVGLGRSGRLHAFEHLGIEPDIIVFGKGLGGGLPISAAVGPAAIMNHRAAFSFQTVHGNPVCASAALAVLDTIERQDLATHAARVGHHLTTLLEELKSSHPLVGDIRGRGLAVGVELVGDAKAPARRETAKVVYRAFELGLVLYYVGINSNVLEMTPSLLLSAEEAATAIEILDRALADVEAGRVADNVVAGFAGW
ncbi:aspartate aminotransferase family protein [Skermanella aerolata]|uniref:Aspartate aminotransferase family protein n=1 Tax=Skermanella aerolata TaxID=393310 RepID=A0A512DTL0_9PROT|nr:aspartate aminotransferase family protein [Skermanella aerolata]KJB94764.1 aminotransferase [Skermanella aerolata KACC 11604]GEO39804.1 aspartate aminotransferase family protein [Skermanella aerolata]